MKYTHRGVIILAICVRIRRLCLRFIDIIPFPISLFVLQFSLAGCTWCASLRSGTNFEDYNSIEASVNEADQYQSFDNDHGDGNEDNEDEHTGRYESIRSDYEPQEDFQDKMSYESEWQDQLNKYDSGSSTAMDQPYMHEHELYVRKIRIIKQLMKKSIKFVLYLLTWFNYRNK